MASVRAAPFIALVLLLAHPAAANPLTDPVTLATTYESDIRVPFVGDPLALPLEVGVSCADAYGGVVTFEVLDAPIWLNRTFEPPGVEVPLDPARCGEDGYYHLPATLLLSGVRRIPMFSPGCAPVGAEAPEPIPTPGLEPGRLHVQASRSPEQPPPAYAGGTVRLSRPFAAPGAADLEVTDVPPEANSSMPNQEGRVSVRNAGEVPLSICLMVETPPGVTTMGLGTSYAGLFPGDPATSHNVSLLVDRGVTEPATVRVRVHAVPEVPGAEPVVRTVEWQVVAPPDGVEASTPEEDVLNESPAFAPLAVAGLFVLAALLRRPRAP